MSAQVHKHLPDAGPLQHRQHLAAAPATLFLGCFGAGRFYTGHTGMAVAQIATTFLTCGLGGLWPLIDGIVILAGNGRDAACRPLRD